MQKDNPALDLHIARKAIREKVKTISGTATAAQLRDLLNLLLADMGLDDPTIEVDASTLPTDVKVRYEKVRQPKPKTK